MRADEFFAQTALSPALTRLPPALAGFLRRYLAHEKVVPFGNQFVVNTHFPPYPSRAFDRFLDALGSFGASNRLYSVTWAVTNRCEYRCWHCYNAGRRETDLPLARMQELARELQQLGAVMVTLTGGEPLLREDLSEIAAAFDDRTCLVVGTTGDGLTAERARALRASGVFAAGISLDSADEAEHDRLRGRSGAFQVALDGLRMSAEAGLYPYIVTVATRERLERNRFFEFLDFAGRAGAREVHLLEPSAVGRLASHAEVCLCDTEREQIVAYQHEVAERDDLPALSSFAYLESAAGFGCGAGVTHLYVDGSGEVCPCNLVPLSFGNASREPLAASLERMGKFFKTPRTGCVGRELRGRIPTGTRPTMPEVSEQICAACVSLQHDEPEFARVSAVARDQGDVSTFELEAAYDRIHGDYDEFWLSRAGEPVMELIDRLSLHGGETVFEAGCGTGFATAQLAARAARVLAVDISDGMLSEARRRVGPRTNVEWRRADALETLRGQTGLDAVFSSWVLGYIPFAPFLAAAAGALVPGGRLAFIVHRQHSPRETLELFWKLIATDPDALRKRVYFDFPNDTAHVRDELARAGLEPVDVREGTVMFQYATADEVLAHLLKSGAGTAFYDALDPLRRPALEQQFLRRLVSCKVNHDYVVCIAQKPLSAT